MKWFWEICAEMDTSQKANLLQFVTGTSKIPLGGFRELRGINNQITPFSIHRTTEIEKLPMSHTCFNQLDLP